MKTHDSNGIINPEFVRASSRADDLVSESLLALRRGDYVMAMNRLKDAERWISDLAESDEGQERSIAEAIDNQDKREAMQ